MFVIKRNGKPEKVHFDKITSRVKKLCYGLGPEIDPIAVAQKVCQGVYSGVTTSELDELAAETAEHLKSTHPDYELLSARILVSNLHKNTKKCWTDIVHDLYTYIEPKSKKSSPLISDKVYNFIMKNKDKLNSAIVYDRDFAYDYFGFKTLERSYLFRIDNKVVERPQHALMRIACGIHCDNLDAALETYDMLSLKLLTHATPTWYNAGTPTPQMSSCFLLTMADDSIEGIYDTLKASACISKYAGGIGISIQNIRASGSYIRGTRGISNGVVPMLRVFNNTARYVDQGGGKRKGSIAVYLEPWHADIFEFLELRKNHGIEEHRARDIFIGLWVPDLFMQKVEADANWHLFCPNECPGLVDSYGTAFNQLYETYAKDASKIRKTIKARKLWSVIMDTQIETGSPYILYKDSCNLKSNQQNLGTIRASNLCTEIIQYTSDSEIAVCNLASIGLPMLCSSTTAGVTEKQQQQSKYEFDFKKLYQVTKVAIKNLNKVIDENFYPVPQAKASNMKHRPVGLGIQGLADTFVLLKMPFESKEAQQLNKDIFETMYFAALTASCELAQKDGPYKSYANSPVSKGILQFDMWNVKPSNRWDWPALRADIAKHGIRNSLLIAPMPTASTSQILGNNECFEPYSSNIYVRRTLAGEFVCITRRLMLDLIERKLWSNELKDKIIANNGSVQNIKEIPADLQELYKTVWEIKIKTLIDMAADRGAFIDQSQSFNVHMKDPTAQKLTSMHFYGWRKGLKTGSYYIRTNPAANPIQFTVDPDILKQHAAKKDQHYNNNNNNNNSNDTSNNTIVVANNNNNNNAIEIADSNKSGSSSKKQNYICTDDVCISCGS